MTAQPRPQQPAASVDAKSVLARLDRLDVWSLPFLFVGIIGLGFLFTFYDVFDINVSFIQSCVALKPGCTPANALNTIRVPIALNLAGYVAGTLLLSPISDRIGRRNMLLVTMMLTGIGSLWNALAPDYTNFVLARIVTGMAIGADLSIVNTYIGEVAPRRDRSAADRAPDPPHERAGRVPGDRRLPGRGVGDRPVHPQHPQPALRGGLPLSPLIAASPATLEL